LTCEPKDLCIALPVRAGRTSAREHLPSYRELASRDPQAEPARTFNRECFSAHRFTFSRLCPTSGGASSFLPASALLDEPPRDLAISRRARRAMRPTDFCHLDELRTPVPRAFPARYAVFTDVDTPRSLGLRAAYRGTECFTALANASADHSWTHDALPLESARLATVGSSSVGVVFPRRPLMTEPLTPLSPLPLPRNVGSAFAPPSLALALTSGIAFPREEAAKVVVTTAS